MSVYAEEERIRAALSHVPADDRDTWVQMGMAVKAELGESGFDLWDDWSRAAKSYSESDARSVWRSFKAGGITIASLFKKAIEHGYAESEPLRAIAPAELQRRRAAREQEAQEATARHERTQAEAADKARELWDRAGTVHRRPRLRAREADQALRREAVARPARRQDSGRRRRASFGAVYPAGRQQVVPDWRPDQRVLCGRDWRRQARQRHAAVDL